MTTICPHCGAILRAGSSVCSYCDSRLASLTDGQRILSSPKMPLPTPSGLAPTASGSTRGSLALKPEWRAELSRRVEAYRKRHRRAVPENQARLPFDPAADRKETEVTPPAGVAVAVDAPPEEDFAFTIAIGRSGPAPSRAFGSAGRGAVERVEIDLTAAPDPEEATADAEPNRREPSVASPLFPIASLGERATAAVVDLVCLLFSYGGFLTLFGSLGGQFSFSKLNAIVYASTLALFYAQYFALFTVFGGTTPGMMLRGMQVVSLTGDRPSPRQLLLRSLGYVLSAGTFFLGFFWACWDEDRLTWHDRISRTYLSATDALPHADVTHPAPEA